MRQRAGSLLAISNQSRQGRVFFVPYAVRLPQTQTRHVTVWPQWPYDDKPGNAKPVGDSRFRWPPAKPSEVAAEREARKSKVISDKEMEGIRAKEHLKIWHDLVSLDWNSWERRFWNMRERSIPYDESTYTLLMHGYMLSHRHAGENAFHVLDEMRKAEIHPALVRINQRFLDAAVELQTLGARPEAGLWQNVTRLCWHCAIRFQKKRRTRLQKNLEALEPNDVLALSPADAQRWLRNHDRVELPASSSGRSRFLSGPSDGFDSRLAVPDRLRIESSRGRKSKKQRR